MYNHFCCGKVSLWPCRPCSLAPPLLRGRVPVLYQRVRLGVRVVALFQVSSGVQQRLLGSAELGSLCLDQVSSTRGGGRGFGPHLAAGLTPLPDIPVGQRGGRAGLPLLHLPGGRNLHGRGLQGRRPLQGAAPLGLQAGLAHGSAPGLPCSTASAGGSRSSAGGAPCCTSSSTAAGAACRRCSCSAPRHGAVQQEVHTKVRRKVDQLSSWETHRDTTFTLCAF